MTTSTTRSRETILREGVQRLGAVPEGWLPAFVGWSPFRNRYWGKVAALAAEAYGRTGDKAWVTAVKWTMGRLATVTPRGVASDPGMRRKNKVGGVFPVVTEDGELGILATASHGNKTVKVPDLLTETTIERPSGVDVDVVALQGLGVSARRLPEGTAYRIPD